MIGSQGLPGGRPNLKASTAIAVFKKLWRKQVGTEPPVVTAHLSIQQSGRVIASIRSASNPRIGYAQLGSTGGYILEQYLPST